MATYSSIAYDQFISAGGSMTLLDTVTVTNSGNITFDGSLATGFSSTYKDYVFKLINIHPATNDVTYTFGVDVSGATNYNKTITSTAFRATHGEDASNGAISYLTSADQAQGTAMQTICGSVGSDNDQGLSGELRIFNPADATFVKHFIATTSSIAHSDRVNANYIAGYVNITTALDKITFAFSSGNQAGTIKMYGIN